VFSFNKKHLEDASIPMWRLAMRGETYYVNHVDCRKGWSTKETPDSSHTKGSIKIRDVLVTFDEDNTAIITDLTPEDRQRLMKSNWVRVVPSAGSKLKAGLAQIGVKDPVIKTAGGGCGTLWFITDIPGRNAHLMMEMIMQGTDMRTLKANEPYYRLYEQRLGDSQDHIDEDEDDWSDLYED
jgi:hypothetical protein